MPINPLEDSFGIQLDNLSAYTLMEKDQQDSGIWGKSLRFDSGVYYHISAPSGTGKTTLGHILYGLRKDFEGKVKINQRNIKRFSIRTWSDIRQREISIVFQNLRLFDDLTGFENIKIKQNLTYSVSDNDIMGMSGQLGVSKILDKRCNKMSQGEKQRVVIIRALVQPFKVLILDEPFSHLDTENSIKAAGLIQKTCESNKAGLIMLQLEADRFFPYHEKIQL